MLCQIQEAEGGGMLMSIPLFLLLLFISFYSVQDSSPGDGAAQRCVPR